ncbi:MAG: hypothetical protein HY669_01880 [Chloroflexi bacterium]|nr:hypothetical protein [Chloroflexota bacterium]
MSFICFDLEGPLSPRDNAYDLMGLFPGGRQVFEVVSRYDDLLALENREGYEPGDTLALIVPFLLCHQLREADIVALAEKASLVAGAAELVARLKDSGWQVFCISTSYEQYASRITQRVGISRHNLACTHFPLDSLRAGLGRDDAIRIARLEQEISKLVPQVDDAVIKDRLDSFYWKELPGTALGAAVAQIKPVGGRRKVAALETFAREHGCSLASFTVVGDSITDARMLSSVNLAGGLAIAFNASEYALVEATVGLASTHISDLWPVLEAWRRGGRQAVIELIGQLQSVETAGDRDNFQWLAAAGPLEPHLLLHRRIRRLVRDSAAKLG